MTYGARPLIWEPGPVALITERPDLPHSFMEPIIDGFKENA